MQLASFIHPELVLHRVSVTSKKRLFESMAQTISKHCDGASELSLYEGLFARERLGSTALGEGVAVPHYRIPDATADCCAIVSLENPIDFDAPDGQPVDLLVFLVVSGEACQEHLDRLAIVAKCFSEQGFRQKARNANSQRELKNLIFAQQQ